MLTGKLKSYKDIPQRDIRNILPRFQPKNFEVNMKLVKELEKVAEKRNCTLAQLSLGWLRSLSKREGMPEIIPIPGTTTVERVEENAIEVELSEKEMDEMDGILARCEVAGDRYHAVGMRMVNG